MPEKTIKFQPLATKNLHAFIRAFVENGDDSIEVYGHFITLAGLAAAYTELEPGQIENHIRITHRLGKEALEQHPQLFSTITGEADESPPDTESS